MTSWTARGHGDAYAKHSHFVPGHRPRLMMTTTQVALLALPVDIYWEKLAGWDLPGKSEETTNAKVHGWNWDSKAALILESVFVLKVALVIFTALQWLLRVPESPFSPRTSRGTCAE